MGILEGIRKWIDNEGCARSHGDTVYHYEDKTGYCAECGEDIAYTEVMIHLMDRTNHYLEQYNNGEIPMWELATMLDHIWDTGKPDWMAESSVKDE